MEQAAHGDEVYFREDHARVAFSVPLGADPDSYFEKAKQEYLRKLEELKRRLGDSHDNSDKRIAP